MIYYLTIIGIAILIEGFFSGAEIAIISLNRIRLRILAEANNKKAVLIHNMLSNPDRLLGTTLVGTNLAVVVASSFCTKLIYDTYGVNTEWLTILIMSPLILIFGELVPKAIFSQRADRITFYLASLLKFFWYLLYPLVWMIAKFVNTILKGVIGPDAAKKSLFVTREEIKHLIRESESEGEIDPYERSIIYKIFDFGKKQTRDVMKGLDELAYLSDTDNISDLIRKAEQTSFSRFPIRAQTGGFLGLVNILDVVYEQDKAQGLTRFIRPLEEIGLNTDIDTALLRLQSKKQTLAIVKNPEGVTVGFFTMEDLLEELVGEI